MDDLLFLHGGPIQYVGNPTLKHLTGSGRAVNRERKYMKYRRLGRTGLYVSEICLGAMTFASEATGMWGAIGAVDQQGVDEMIGRALASGVNFIDTADVYSAGQSEQMVGAALRNLGVKRSDVVIATKCFGEMGSGPNDKGASRGHIMDAVRASLDRMQLDYIDLYQIHADDPVTPVEETLRALDDLVSQGLVRYVGCSNWPAWKMMKAHGIADQRGYARFETAALAPTVEVLTIARVATSISASASTPWPRPAMAWR